MNTADSSTRVKALKVTGLFGLYTHQVTLKEDRVTVIHGPNGVGKTVLLKLTDGFLRGRYNEIVRVPFKTFEILFDNNSVATVAIEHEAGGPKKVHVTFEPSAQPAETITLEGESLNTDRIAQQVAEASPYLSQVGPEVWVDRRTDEVLSVDEVVARASEFTPKELKKWKAKEPKGLRELRSRIRVHLIEAQRLIRLSATAPEWHYRTGPSRTTRATVQEYSQDLKRRLETTLANYAKQSQKLDQTFPQRLLQGTHRPLPLEELSHEMKAVEATRDRLKRIGILDRGDPGQDAYPVQSAQLESLQENQIEVMSVYAQDTKEKLSVLEPLSARIEILLSVLNRKFTNKTVSISRESGIAVFGSDQKPIPVTALSSGEQHELVLLYDLLFKVEPNTLVLIDEPELSLHISWQKGFMDDLLEIIRIAHFDVLIATHSPYIVGDRSDLLVVLSPEVLP